MARVSYIVLIFACFVACAFADDEEFYPDKYDHLDVDAVLANERLRTQYYKCFLDTAPCRTPDAVFFKERFPEAVVTKCRKCTEKQKYGFGRIADWFTENDPEAWEAVIRKAVNDFTLKGIQRKEKMNKKET